MYFKTGVNTNESIFNEFSFNQIIFKQNIIQIRPAFICKYKKYQDIHFIIINRIFICDNITSNYFILNLLHFITIKYILFNKYFEI